MRGVVGGEAVDRAVLYAFDQRARVGLRAQRRIDLVVETRADQVVRRDLAGERKPLGLGAADELHRFRVAHVAYVQVAADFAQQRDIPRNGLSLRLAVRAHDETVFC